MIRRRDQIRLSAQKLGLRKKRAFFSVTSVALGVIVVVAVNSLIDSVRDLVVRTQFTEDIDKNVVRIYVTDNPYQEFTVHKADKPKITKKRYQFLNEAAFEEMRAWPEVVAADSPVTVNDVSLSALTNRPTNVSHIEGVPDALFRQYARESVGLSNAIPVVLGERNIRLAYNPVTKKFDVAPTNSVAGWIGREMTITVGDHFAGVNRFDFDSEKKQWSPVPAEELAQKREAILRNVQNQMDSTIFSASLPLRARVVGTCPGNRVLVPLDIARQFEKWLDERAALSSLGQSRAMEEEVIYGARGRSTPRAGEFREGMIVVKDGTDTDAVSAKVREMGFEATTRGSAFEFMVHEFDSVVRVVKKIAFAFGAVILGIACGLLWSTTSRIVADSRVDIGLMRALGATKSDIRRLFLSEAVWLGMLGTLFGMLGGWAVAYGVGRWVIRLARLDVSDPEQTLMVPDSLFRVDLQFCLMLLAGAAVVSLLAGVFPANRAANVDPVKALKRE